MFYKDLDDCDDCPILNEGICKGGWTSNHRGNPVEPPCTMFNDDTDLDEWIESYYASIDAFEEHMDMLEKEKKEKERKNEIKRRKAYYMKNKCYSLIHEKKAIQKAINRNRSLDSMVSSFTSAVNITNEMFGYSERINKNDKLQKEYEELYSRLEEVNKELKIKQKEIRGTDEYKSIGKT